MSSASVAGHRRRVAAPGRVLRSVRFQLLAPIIVAVLGLAGLGAVQTRDAITAALDAERAQVLAQTATATARLVHELQREVAETGAFRSRGATAGKALVIAQRDRVDLALRRFTDAVSSSRADVAAPRPTFDETAAALAELPRARELAETISAAADGERLYRDASAKLLKVADGLAVQLSEPRLAGAAREIAAIVVLEDLAAQERDLLRRVFGRAELTSAAQVELGRLEGARQQRQDEFRQFASTESLRWYNQRVAGEDVDRADRLIKAVLAGGTAPAELNGDVETWNVAQSNAIRRLNLLSLDLSDRLDRTAAATASATRRRAVITSLFTFGMATLVLTVASYLAVRTSRRLRRLRAASLTVAYEELPQAVRAAAGGMALSEVEQQFGDATRMIRSGLGSARDEIGDVADAFTIVHNSALWLAAEQAELRVDMSRMAEILARRLRTLVERQLRLLDEFERAETDPAELARLFALDQLAARMRRNGENLLVLAGGDPGRRESQPYPLSTVVMAAASEIEQFERVRITVEPVDIEPAMVGPLTRLLAELLDNAATYSPPNTQVVVDTRRTPDGITVRVHDHGIGIPSAKLATINSRLLRPQALSSAAAGTMGLHVVAQLAARHGLRVQLRPTSTGISAFVDLPHRATAGPEDKARPAADVSPADTKPMIETRKRIMPPAAHAGAKPGPHNGHTGDQSLALRSPGQPLDPELPAAAPAAPADPDAIRTRLSALSNGVLAAQRRGDEPRPAGPSTTGA